MQEFLRLGEIDEKWHVLLDKTFGPQVRQRLTQWVHSESVVMLAHQLTMHARTHNMPLSPPFNQERSTCKNPCCLIFGEVRDSVLRPRPGKNGASDPPRHFSPASRELDCAIERFMYLKENNL